MEELFAKIKESFVDYEEEALLEQILAVAKVR